ncbi:MAG: hypothetical protein D6812_06390 [Deltaproteobacteria bacterium]|nr:MAG: hypothetical protein D6812_06390 [Deltaproteobacteria bacterium]
MAQEAAEAAAAEAEAAAEAAAAELEAETKAKTGKPTADTATLGGETKKKPPKGLASRSKASAAARTAEEAEEFLTKGEQALRRSTKLRRIGGVASLVALGLAPLFLERLFTNSQRKDRADPFSIEDQLRLNTLLGSIPQQVQNRAQEADLRFLAAAGGPQSPGGQRFLNTPTLARNEVLIGDAIQGRSEFNRRLVIEQSLQQTAGPNAFQQLPIQANQAPTDDPTAAILSQLQQARTQQP